MIPVHFELLACTARKKLGALRIRAFLRKCVCESAPSYPRLPGCGRRGIKALVVGYQSSRAAFRINDATAYGLDNIATWLDERVIDVAFIC